MQHRNKTAKVGGIQKKALIQLDGIRLMEIGTILMIMGLWKLAGLMIIVHITI